MKTTIYGPPETHDLVKEIQEWGGCISELLLESSPQVFYLPHLAGCIGYYLKYKCAIVVGDPVCPSENIEPLLEAFQKDCQENKLKIIYFVASESLTERIFPRYCPIKIQVGEELVYDPFHDPLLNPKAHKLRNKVQSAKKNGLTVGEYTHPDLEIEQALSQVAKDWGENRNGPQMYLGDLQLFNFREGRRWIYIKNQERFLGVALLKKMDAQQGWLLKFHIVLQDSPRGTSELLMVSLLEILRNENCHFLTFGIVPTATLNNIEGLGTISKWIAKKYFAATNWFFHLNNRMVFWGQFQPATKPAYILFSTEDLTLSELYALMGMLKIKF